MISNRHRILIMLYSFITKAFELNTLLQLSKRFSTLTYCFLLTFIGYFLFTDLIWNMLCETLSIDFLYGYRWRIILQYRSHITL